MLRGATLVVANGDRWTGRNTKWQNVFWDGHGRLYHAWELQMKLLHVASLGHKMNTLFTTNSAEINLSSHRVAKASALRKTNTLKTNNTFTFPPQK